MAKKINETNSGSIMRQLMHGQVVSSDFFARNWVAMALVVFVLLIYIASKYTCQTKMEQVRRLTHELEVVKAERVRQKSEYMGSIRESAMQHMVDSLNLGLSVQEYPPFVMSGEK